MSRILLLSDIHANLAALDAVLFDAARRAEFDAVWSLGDAVGYGPRPNECLDRLREIEAVTISGNHELAALGEISASEFNPFARFAIEWTASALTPESRAYIEAMPLTAVHSDFTLAHGTPRDPVWEYLTDIEVAKANVDQIETLHCIVGHTHVPAAFRVSRDDTELWPGDGEAVSLNGARWFLNPGSVGQPRDGDPRAAYALLDLSEMVVEFRRVEYPIEETQRQMEAVDLPDMLIQRLSFGR